MYSKDELSNKQQLSCESKEITEAQEHALDRLASRDDYAASVWEHRIRWMNNNDTTDSGERVLRTDTGFHFVVGSGNRGVLGFGGTPIHFYYTTGPNEGEIFTSTDTWYQGEIPEELQHLMPSNVRILTYKEWRELNEIQEMKKREAERVAYLARFR